MRPALVGLMLAVLASACETTHKGLRADCDSDKECLYGLVCKGAPVGEAGPRHCVYEEYSRCTDDTECYRGRVCRDTHCEVQCVRDEECGRILQARPGDLDGGLFARGTRCVLGECTRSETADKVCYAATDCSPDEECVSGRCVVHFRDHPGAAILP